MEWEQLPNVLGLDAPSMATGMGAGFGHGGDAGEAENNICVFWGAFVSSVNRYCLVTGWTWDPALPQPLQGSSRINSKAHSLTLSPSCNAHNLE